MPDLKDRLRALREEFDREVAAAGDASVLQTLRDRYLGRKAGAITALMKSLGSFAPEERRGAGQDLNELKDHVERRLETAGDLIAARGTESRLASERVDITLPGRIPPHGRRHPLTNTREDLEDIFLAMGYEIFDGPEVEDDYHNFEALNMPPDHPPLDMQDTVYLSGGRLLLRTHTSSGQIRYM